MKFKRFLQNIKGRYGVRRVYQELLNRGFAVNHKRVQRLMHVMGLQESDRKKSITLTKGKSVT